MNLRKLPPDFFEKTIREKKLAPSYLVEGDPIPLAQILLCETHLRCGICSGCRKVLSRNHPDLIILEPEKGSLKIEAVREMTRRLAFRPLEGESLVVVLLDSDLLTEGAANALLKSLEEPPPYVTFFLSTSIPDRLLATIRSRCQRIPRARRLEQDSFSQTFLPLWEGKLLPRILEERGKGRWTAASSLAETVLEEVDDPKDFLQGLERWWHHRLMDSLTPSLHDEPHYLDSQLRGWDLILETERALEGNVLKQLALERLFLNLFP